MAVSHDQIRLMYLAGTVCIPPSFPDLGRISFQTTELKQNGHSGNHHLFLVVDDYVSHRLTIRRSFFANDVTAVFIPDDPECVELSAGKWFVGSEILGGLRNLLDQGREVWGIAYVREQASALMVVEVGMTAAESAEYYPPLPGDRSVDHYAFQHVHATPGPEVAGSTKSAMCSRKPSMRLKRMRAGKTPCTKKAKTRRKAKRSR